MLFLSIYFFLYPSFYSKSCSHPVLGNHSSPSILIIQVFPRTCCHKKATKNQIENDPVLTQRHRKWSEIAALFLPPKDCGKGGGAYLFSSRVLSSQSDVWFMSDGLSAASASRGGATAPYFSAPSLRPCRRMLFFFPSIYIAALISPTITNRCGERLRDPWC